MKLTAIKTFACLLFILFFLNMEAGAQAEHFVYIQSDGQRPFKATVDGKTFNSSSIGYVILPKLKDSVYNLSIDLTGDTGVHLNFPLTVKKDAGYELRNFGLKGWGLFNLLTMNIITEGKAAAKIAADTAKPVVKNTAFGDMLSDVVNDSTLTKPAEQNKPVAAETINTSPAATNNIPAATENNSAISKVLEENSDTGTHAVFVDVNNPHDTVAIFIPATNAAIANNSPANGSSTEINATASTAAQSNTIANAATDSSMTTGSKKVGNPFYSSADSSANGSKNTQGSQLTNTNCKNMASDEDLAKLRKKIITETDADIMIVVAKKILKGKCVTTSQVKTIGALFVTDEARYTFYETMYNSTYDYGNYPALGSQLIDPYYKKRFQSLLR